MKILTTILFLFLTLSLFAQQKGATPIPKSEIANPKSTYAVVVGISDYQDEGIPDLRFADKDALAFAGFLQSPAGGSLDEDHLKVLINKQATVAQFAIALDWLWEVVKENDRVIIYFSGHGDVERKSLTQPGFLLCWDAPSKIYLAGGTLALPMFQEVISTLSVQNKAKVIVITDACRSGKLSGSSVGGSQLTSSNLAKQYANEIKILSCQPDEYSIEGEQWGGGRGAFSYHLLDGLYGMADRDNDQTVTVREIDMYLGDHVTPEVAPQNQLPMIVGNGREKLTDIFPDILAQIKEGKKGQMPMFTATESRGIEDDVLEAADSNVVELYHAFQKALADKQFLFAEKGRSENDFADAYYGQLIKEPSLERLHSSMRRNYAAALQDDAQQVMNGWMKTSQDQLLEAEAGEKKGRLPIKVFTEKLRAFPACLERAAELLGKEHYMYATLQARKYFFEGFLLANSDRNPNKELGGKALAQFRQALEWQPELPQAYWQMINVYGYNFLQPDSAEVYAQKAIALYPSWEKPYTNLAFMLSEKYKLFDRARPYLEQVMQIDSSSLHVLNNWGIYHMRKKDYDEAEKYLKKATQIDSTFMEAYSNLGLLYKKNRRYGEAEIYYKKAIQLDSTNTQVYNNLGNVYLSTRRYDEAEKYLKKATQIDSTFVNPYVNMGNVYTNTRRYDEAEKYFKKAIQLDSTKSETYNNFGLVYMNTGRYEEAEKYFKKAIQLDSAYTLAYSNLGNIYYYTRHFEEAEKYYKKAIQLDSTFTNAYNNLGSVYENTHRFDEAEKYLKKAIQLDSTFAFYYINLGNVYRQTGRYEEAEKFTKKAIQLDSTVAISYGNMGAIYRETRRYEEAEKNYKKVIQLDSTDVNAYYNIACMNSKNNHLDKAFDYLEQAIKNGFNNYDWMNEDTDLSNLREQTKRWKELMKKYFPEKVKD